MGLLHGIFQCAGRAFSPLSERARIPAWVKVAFTFCLVTFAWIFFRAPSLHDALLICKKIALIPSDILHVIELANSLGIKETLRVLFALDGGGFGGFAGMAKLLLFVLGFCVVETATAKKGGLYFVNRLPLAVRWGMYVALVRIILGNFSVGRNTEFLYFAF